MLYSFVADHFQYLASIGLMVLGAALLRRGGEVALARICARREGVRRRLLAAAAVVLCATLGLLTRAQTRIYDNTQTLWSDTLAKNPDSWLAAVNLGGTRLDQAMLLEARGDAQRARAFYREARRLLERSLAIRESNAYAHNNLGMVLMQTGETAAAREQLETAIRQRPDYAEPYNNLGVLLWRQGKLDAAAGALERALELKDDYVDALRNLGFVANEQGRADRAIELMRQVLALRPTDLRVRVVLADLLRATGRPAEALTHYRFVLRQEPGHEAAARGAAAAEQALRAAGDRSRPGGR
jgi:tetratricopeptide (TPR) repeat protein